MSQKEVDYKKKMELCDRLGARSFKKVVLRVEKLKWSIIKKLSPDFLSKYEIRCEKNLKRALKNAKTEEDKARIRSYYRHQILTARKEFNHEQNRNYHMTSNRPTEILRYLEWNKEVHQNGLIKNMVTGIIASGFICAGVGTTLAAVVLGIQAIDSVINFQCINLQNYNIYRIEARKDGLEKLAARRMEMAEKKYGEAAKVISRTFRETKEENLVPTPEAIIARIENPEQLMQLKMMVEAAKKTYQTSETKTDVKGGRRK